VVEFVKDYETKRKNVTVQRVLPETVVLLDVLVQVWNDCVFCLPCGLVVRQVSPFHEVPQRSVFQQPMYIHTITLALRYFKTPLRSIQQMNRICTNPVYSFANLLSFRIVHFTQSKKPLEKNQISTHSITQSQTM